ncbi:MAG: dTDP-4-dehydrorhamnose 3,5-epimerase family protein [Bacteroidetes bacterium]|nr:dTDP-4-dehydrorhamnose 3,5-epimerase family protein [Bacteroidota bacterium]
MQILDIKELSIPDVKVIKFVKNNDFRGYFSETFNINDIQQKCLFLNNFSFVQTNESFSFANTFRGLHIQNNMGKLVRLIYGNIIDFALDLRKESKYYKKIIGYNLSSTCDYSEWIWLPPGIAHGMLIKENSMVEYFCSTVYNPEEQHNISIFSDMIDWELCNVSIYNYLFSIDKNKLKIKAEDLICQ